MAGVSVIIPVLNAERWIGGCIESVLASRYAPQDMEVICVDNGSSDGTSAILRKFQPAIRVLHEPRRGPAAARNAGLRSATREFVAFTDADCCVDADWLENILKPLQAGAGASGGRILARPQAGPVELFGELIHDHERAIESDRPPYLITMNMASRLALLRSIGMFDEGWIRMEDCELSYRILEAGERIRYQGDAIVYHHNRDTLRALAREGFLHGYYTPAFRRKHGPFVQAYRKSGAREPVRALTQPPSAGSQLESWRLRMYWRLFRTSKSVGMWAGRCFLPRIE